MNKHQQDRELRKIQDGDEQSFGKVYDWYVDKIYRYVFLKIGSKEKVEEIVQDVFLKFWRFVRDKENEVKDINALLYSIAKSMIADYYRSAGENIISLDETMMIEDETSEEETMSDDIDISLDIEKVKGVLKRMPQIYQDVIIMKFVEEMEHSEIAEALGKEEGNVRVLAHRALKQLRELLKSDD